MKTLRPETPKTYLDAAGKQGALSMFYLELVCEIRKGDLLALRWKNLGIPRKTISASKQATKSKGNQPDRVTPQGGELYLAGFHLSESGGAAGPETRQATLLKRIFKDARLKHFRFYAFRHTFSTLALREGVDIKIASAMLRHYDAGFTLRAYTHIIHQKQGEIAQAMGWPHGAGTVTLIT